MKGISRVALVTLGIISVVAIGLCVLPGSDQAASPKSAAAQAEPALFHPAHVYRTPEGGLIQTQVLRWAGHGGMMVITWSRHVQVAPLARSVVAELQGMAAQQRLQQAVIQQMIDGDVFSPHLQSPSKTLSAARLLSDWPRAPIARVTPKVPAIPAAVHPMVDL